MDDDDHSMAAILTSIRWGYEASRVRLLSRAPEPPRIAEPARVVEAAHRLSLRGMSITDGKARAPYSGSE